MVEKVKEKNPDVVVIGDMLHSYGGYGIIAHFNESAALIKAALPKTKIILGGLWYSAMPVETLEDNPAVDFVVMGEEESFYDLVDALKKERSQSSRRGHVPDQWRNRDGPAQALVRRLG